jgi:16S rRNA C967 or C1407 C5-methylase (RsmB/RsmF family)
MQASNLLLRLARQLFCEPESQQAFVSQLTEPKELPQALIWTKDRPEEMCFALEPRSDWQPAFVDRVSPGQKPGAHELHEKGCYYCLDFSSVFQASVLCAAAGEGQIVCDLCSAPGGKAVFAAALLRPETLICNEVIRKRTAQLIANLKRCSISKSIVISVDVSVLAAAAACAADIVIADAPCSGQSLLVKGKKAPGCFHPVTINMNSRRQKRIIANAASVVAPGGHLAYMTCTYSREENEEVVDWFLKKFPAFVPQEVPALQEHTSHLGAFPCYRLWPQQGLGAGGFTVLLQNQKDGRRRPLSLNDLRILWKSGDYQGG